MIGSLKLMTNVGLVRDYIRAIQGGATGETLAKFFAADDCEAALSPHACESSNFY